MKNKFLSLPENTRINIFTQTAEKVGMTAFAVEKDWWVAQTLISIFQLDVGEHLVFKGGTSLSKSWDLIQRFSEDIDLAIEREFLGFEGDLSKNKKTNLRKASGKYISEHFLPELEQKFKENGLENVRFELVNAEDSDQDPRIINIFYPSVISTVGYLEPKVQVEIGCRSLIEPFTLKYFAPLINIAFPKQEFVENPSKIPSINLKRTFLEKLFLLHEEFQKPFEKIRVNRLSRHLNDVYILSRDENILKAIEDRELYETIVKHRLEFTKISGVDYTLHNPKTINPIPPKTVINKWQEDYERMSEDMIYGENKPSFSEIIESLQKLKKQINNLDWKII